MTSFAHVVALALFLTCSLVHATVPDETLTWTWTEEFGTDGTEFCNGVVAHPTTGAVFAAGSTSGTLDGSSSFDGS
eukprot:82673-Amphidinium_carterae.1